MNRITSYSLQFILSMLIMVSELQSQDLPIAKPEDVGMSSERLQQLTNRFEAYVADQKMAGSVTLVARKGKVVYYESVGMNDIKAKKPMTEDAIFRIASQTKAIVSTGIMILQEEGKLLIQDKVGDYIPEFMETTVAEPNNNGGYDVVKATRAITIRDLLTHTSGIGYGGGIAKAEWEKAGITGWYFADREEPILETVRRMASLPMDAQPGTQWVYGYSVDILGAIVEVASGMPLDQFLKNRIFEPLNMNDTYFYLPKEKENRLTTVYHPVEDSPLEPAPKEGTMNAQGAYIKGPRKSFSGGAGLLSTAMDYYLFLQMVANGGILNGRRILSPKTVELMTCDHLNGISFRNGQGFGLGFDVVTDVGAQGYPGSKGEFGWGGAYGSTYWVDPVEELVVVYFTQLRPGSIVKDQLMLRALVYQSIIE